MSTATTTTQVPGQQTLPGMAEAMGYDTIVLKPDEERFCWEYVRNGGNATRAYLTVNPETTPDKARKNASKETTPDKARKNASKDKARKNASKLIATKSDILLRIAQIQAEIAREWKGKVRDFHGRSLEFDPADAFFAGSNRKSITDMPEEIRKLCTLEARVVDGSVIYIPVFPDKIKAAAELAKMMGMIVTKNELTGAGGAPLSIIGKIEMVAAGHCDE